MCRTIVGNMSTFRAASLKRAKAPKQDRGESRLSARDSPTTEQIRAARTQAGLTQSQAADLAGYGAQSRWAEIESGRRAIDHWRWRLFLHRAGLTEIPFTAIGDTPCAD